MLSTAMYYEYVSDRFLLAGFSSVFLSISDRLSFRGKVCDTRIYCVNYISLSFIVSCVFFVSDMMLWLSVLSTYVP